MRALDEGKGFRFTDEEVNFKGAERAIKKVRNSCLLFDSGATKWFSGGVGWSARPRAGIWSQEVEDVTLRWIAWEQTGALLRRPVLVG